MDRTLQLGPLALPWTLVILLVCWQLGTLMHERLSARSGLAPGPHGWRLMLAALLAARLGFVLHYPAEYGATPSSVLDIRDGGWQPWAGLAAALFYVAVLWLRRNPWRQATTAGLATFAALWFTGLALLQAAAPPNPQGLPPWHGLTLGRQTFDPGRTPWPARGGESLGQLVSTLPARNAGAATGAQRTRAGALPMDQSRRTARSCHALCCPARPAHRRCAAGSILAAWPDAWPQGPADHVVLRCRWPPAGCACGRAVVSDAGASLGADCRRYAVTNVH